MSTKPQGGSAVRPRLFFRNVMINFTFCVYKNNEIGNLRNANANENGNENLQTGGNLRIQQTHNKTGSPNSNVGGPMPNPLGTDFRMNFGACTSLDLELDKPRPTDQKLVQHKLNLHPPPS